MKKRHAMKTTIDILRGHVIKNWGVDIVARDRVPSPEGGYGATVTETVLDVNIPFGGVKYDLTDTRELVIRLVRRQPAT